MVLSEIFGEWKFAESVPDSTSFGDLIRRLDKRHNKQLTPYLFEEDGHTLAQHIMFMVNGRNIRFLNGEKTILQDEDQVTILLPAGGG